MDIQIFNNPEFGELRTLAIDGVPYFVGKDVATNLGYVNPRDALAKHVDAEDKRESQIATSSGVQTMAVINESGLYSLILSSKLPTAKKFKHWVTSEVLPSIRKHGAYITPATLDNLLNNPEFAIRLFTELKNERARNSQLAQANAVLNQRVLELTPKADYYDTVLKSPNLLTVSEFSEDYGMSAKQMNKLLKSLGIQYKQNKIWLLYQKYAPNGWTKTETITFQDKKGITYSTLQTRWTQKGRLALYNILKNNGYLPLIEQDSDGGYYE